MFKSYGSVLNTCMNFYEQMLNSSETIFSGCKFVLRRSKNAKELRLLRYESLKLVYTMSFCCLHAISNKLLFAQRLEIINSKAKFLRRSNTIDFGKIVLNKH